VINFLRYRDQAVYPEGFDATPCTGREAFQRFSAVMAPLVTEVKGKTIWMGQVQASVIAPNTEQWHEAILIEYPSRKAFLELVTRSEYKDASIHRTAALADSRLIATKPVMSDFSVP
jgi:uncharacterized protein (DUF1330 family)